jgi:tetratricopeptide (TPR) repeat protein
MRLAGSDGSGDGARWRVFVSHTSELRDFPRGQSYVAEVERAISATGHVIVDMADFPATDQPAAQVCIDRVLGCDVYVGVLGTRYGSPVRDKPEVSYSELEFDTATQAGMDRLVFLLDTDADNVGIPVSQLIDREFGDRQDAFRRKVRNSGLTTQFFANPAKLGQLAERSLQDLAKTRRRSLGEDDGLRQDPNDRRPAVENDVFQLPRDIPDFTGRDNYLAKIREALENCADQETALTISVVSGKAGVGKTTLAVHAAHQMRDWFPDGQLYVNLRGAEAQALEPTEVLASFLRSIGVDGMSIPLDIGDRANMYRARMARRRILVLLDNAADEVQVRPLLPGSPGSAVIVTSRKRLGTLEGVVSIDLDVMAVEPAEELLGKVAGADRVAAELEAAADIVRLCGYLPLAIRIAGAKLAQNKLLRLRDFSIRLASERRRLEVLRIGDLDVRASFDLSYNGRPELEQRAFRLLGLLDAPDFPPWVVAALLDEDIETAENVLERLAEVQLVEVVLADTAGQYRFRLHDLLRLFARERLDEEPAREQRAAAERVVGGYLALAEQATGHLEPGNQRVLGDGDAKRWAIANDAVRLTNDHESLNWFTAEQANLVIAVEQAHQLKAWSQVWELCGVLREFFDWRSQWDDWRRTHELAEDAARQAGVQLWEAAAVCNLGSSYRDQYRWIDALTHLERCLQIFQALGNRRWEAYTILEMGLVHRGQCLWERSEQELRSCLVVFRELGDRRAEAITLHYLGDVDRDHCRWNLSLQSLRQSLPLFQELHDRRWVALTQECIALSFLGQGYWEQSVPYFNSCLPIFQELGDRRQEAYVMHGLGDAHREKGDGPASLNYLYGAIPIFKSVGERIGEAYTIHSVGLTHYALGDLAAARAAFDQSMAIFVERDDDRGMACVDSSIGELYRKEGRRGEARIRLERSLSVFRRLGDCRWEAQTLAALGAVFVSEDELAAAKSVWSISLTIYRNMGSPRAAELEQWLAGLDRREDASHSSSPKRTRLDDHDVM